MKYLAFVLLLFASTLSSGLAEARSYALNFRDALRAARTITIPPEWDGIWEVPDTTYQCPTLPIAASADSDTICGGEMVTKPTDTPTPVTCTGSADANELHFSCTGSEEIFPGCNVTFTTQMDVTRTEETFFSVSVTSVTYTGSASGCSSIPGFCEQINTHGTRVSPSPPGHCETPVRPSTWGQIKTIYR